MKTEKETKISAYLRLAELCGIDEEQKKQEYMKKVEELLNDSKESFNIEDLCSKMDKWYHTMLSKQEEDWKILPEHYTWNTFENCLKSFDEPSTIKMLLNAFLEDTISKSSIKTFEDSPHAYSLYLHARNLSIKGRERYNIIVRPLLNKKCGVHRRFRKTTC